ncbi:MAG: hypothetical protein H6557_01750 [Lewinellaceae bacterium]|nr:hypothetical protein [Lewinellaceae bacterium]
MKYIILAGILISVLQAGAQTKPDFFPEDVTSGGNVNGLRCYCQPGIRNNSRSKGLELYYGYFGGGVYKAQDTMLTSPLTEFRNHNHLKASLKAPVLNKDNLKVLLTFSYSSEVFDIKRFGPDFNNIFHELNDADLKNSTLGIVVAKPLDEIHYLAFRFRLAANGNYAGLGRYFEDRYAIYKFYGIYAVKPSEDLEWGIGLAYSKSFRRNNLVPFLVYNRNLNNKWGIEAVLPANAFLRYNLGHGDILLLGAEYDSQSYRLLIPTPGNGHGTGVADFAMNHSEFLLSARAEHKFAEWIWGNFKFGYRMNFSTNFEAKSPGTVPFNVDPSNSFFFQIGFFLSPPDHLRE